MLPSADAPEPEVAARTADPARTHPVPASPQPSAGARRPAAAHPTDPVPAGAAPAGAGPARRRGPADPVRAVMHRHRETIGGAVDVWEIAAGLEARGVADADAWRLRHRDVFGLAEEVDARRPRPEPAAGRATAAAPGRFGPRDAALHLLPGAVCAAAYGLPAHVGTVLALLAGYAVLRRSPLRIRGAATAAAAAAAATCALLAFAALPAAQATALAVSLAPAAYCAHLFAVGARRRLTASRTLSGMARAVRPRLAAALAGYALALLAVLYPAGHPAAPVALGLLLFTARLTAVHGRQWSAAAVLAAAAVAAGLYRLADGSAGAAPAAAAATTAVCAVAAAFAAVHAFRVLPRASAHRPG